MKSRRICPPSSGVRGSVPSPRPARNLWSGSVSAWQPMDTAPRDGTRIIGWFGDHCIIVFWREGPGHGSNYAGGKIWYWSSGYNRHPEPDCWQPAPRGPDASEFPSKAPPPAPRGRTFVASPAARRRLVEHTPKREIIQEKRAPKIYEMKREWCGQCERNVTAAEAKFCPSIFCKAKAGAA